MADATEELVAAAQLVTTQSPQYRDVYSNNVTASLSPHDMTLLFAQNKPGQMGQSPVAELQVAVTFAPVQFKLLADLCARITKAYELAYGEIHLTVADRQQPRPTAEQIAERIMASYDQTLSPSSSSEPLPPEKPARAAGKGSKKKP